MDILLPLLFIGLVVFYLGIDHAEYENESIAAHMAVWLRRIFNWGVSIAEEEEPGKALE